MEKHIVQGSLPAKQEKILWNETFSGKYRVFAIFLVCCAMLIAAFAISSVWLDGEGGAWLWGLGGLWENGKDRDGTTESDTVDLSTDELESREEETGTPPSVEIPKGATPVVSRDLAYLSLGYGYIHNETPYTPNVDALLASDISIGESDPSEPLVLVLHTHTSEAFLPVGAQYIEGAVGNATYSRDETNNILAVGAAFCEALKEKGITAIHCTVMHDDPTLSGAYARAEATIEEYLERYPSILYVIDLHRDAITTADGSVVRSVSSENGGEEIAQVMAVVGTDANGTDFPHWEENLALALQLRETLNANGAAVCRPVSLRNSSYNQEMAAHALLLEIGTSANSVDEAKRAAVLVGDALAHLLQER